MAYSPADLDLARRVVESGRIPPSTEDSALAERIRKWNGWGIIEPPPPAASLGRGKGSLPSRYPSEAEDLVVAMFDAFRAVGLRPRHKGVLVAWWRGAPVGHRALKEAFTWGLKGAYETAQQRARVRSAGGVRDVLPNMPAGDRKVVMEGLSAMLTSERVRPNALLMLARLFEPSVASLDVTHLSQVLHGLAATRELQVDAPLSLPSAEQLASSLVKADLQGKKVAAQSLREVTTSFNALAGLAAVDGASRAELDAHREALKLIMGQLGSPFGEPDEVTMALMVPIMAGALDTLDDISGRRSSRLKGVKRFHER